MTDEIVKPMAFPRRPRTRAQNYDVLRDSQVPSMNTDVFTMTITASKEGEHNMDNRQLLIDLVFKPLTPGLKLRLAESQLLLAYIGEILKEIEVEESLETGLEETDTE